jgi:putative transposase
MDLRHRKRMRLGGFDYSEEGMYFVTICTHERREVFGSIVTSVGSRHASTSIIKLNQSGEIIKKNWEILPNHYPVELDILQIMPDHVHFVIKIINLSGEACLAPTRQLSSIVGSFKSQCTMEIRQCLKREYYQLWQRGYYDHIIRNDNDLNRIRNYISENPSKWAEELEFTQR